MACQLKNKEEIVSFCQENRVKFIRLWFTNVLGSLKSFAIPIEELENAFQEGMGFDGSSIKGFARIDESDMIALPDPATFQILPWRSGEEKVGRMFCDILNPDGSPYDGDSRYILKKNLERLKEKGFSFYVGPELEFFYFKNDREPLPLDLGGYFDLTTLDAASDLRRDTIRTLEEMGIRVEYSHHEVAFSQHEIDLRYADALIMGDQVMTHRIVVKEIAQKYGVYATFIPKPVMGINGSGMHTHQSLFQGDKNAFFDAQDPYFLSDLAKKYVAGILRYAKEIALVTNQWVNSYKRLVPGYEAPVYICWARRNRSTLVRIPMYKPGKEKATRIEVRNPDPACNPYLAFSAMLAAGLAGIEGNYELSEPIERDVYHMSQEEREQLKIDSLPGSLREAIDYASQSKILREALGDHIFDFLIKSKLVEWDEYRTIVHPYEIERYFPIL
jgi:glutamine synthetase